ncbi:MAG: TIGR03619 family F420-dependent LLM class oxidoreductase [Acidimicrobiales bacterium]|nr:TIGR03619 family F420-dependent LLM class oxidoreductase [Acidimicrobiales bacterium]
MRFSFSLPHLLELPAVIQPWELDVDGAGLARAAKRADELGFAMLNVPEHLVIPDAHVELSGAFYFHATAAQGFLAGATERIRIGSCITLLPLHHPIALAKALSTIDWMSGGRAVACFGVGWLEEEFDMLGVPFHERGRLADEYLEAILTLWTEESASFEGKYVSFRDAAFAPKPVQSPHIPIWFGGDADPALRRLARFGSGWMPFLTPPEQLPQRIDYICSQPTWQGGTLEVHYSLAALAIGEGHVPTGDDRARVGADKEQIIDALGHLASLGVTATNAPIPPTRSLDEHLDLAQWFMEEVAPHV